MAFAVASSDESVLSCVEQFASWAILDAQNRIGARAETPSAWADQTWTAMSDFTGKRMGGGRLHLSNLSCSRESLLNQDEFRLQRWRKRIDFCREVLFDLCEMRIQDSDDCGRELLEFV